MFSLRKCNYLFVNIESLLLAKCFHNNSLKLQSILGLGVTTVSEKILHNEKVAHLSSRSKKKVEKSSRMATSGIHQNQKQHFNIQDYDIIGFDLDCTLLRYNLEEMIPLEYTCLSNSLQRRGYPAEKLSQPLNLDFLQRGLILDALKGNVIKLDKNGKIIKAFHGEKPLNDEEVDEIYGADRKWIASSEFIKNPMNTWNGPYSEQMRTCLDYFDIPISLVMARAVESIDINNDPPKEYKVWDDILAGLFEMYKRENFNEGTSEYFEALKQNPERYLLKTNDRVIQWLKDLKEVQGKALFLLTGSDISFANFTASYALGENWRHLFDSVICYAKKPGFFIENDRPFYQIDLEKLQEGGEISTKEQLKFDTIYSQGCWSTLKNLLIEKTGNCYPKTLYIGDNLVQDVLCPSRFANMDTVAISEEMFTEQVPVKKEVKAVYNDVTSSCIWGSYYKFNETETLWLDIIKKYSKICVPTIDYLVDLKKLDDTQFYPSPPLTK